MGRFRWGIFGTGAISAKFAAGLQIESSAEVSYVASRSLANAQAFAAGAGIKRAVQGYEEAAAQGGVDAIYIATPPAYHGSHALTCIAAGIPVLVEKPFTFAEDDARRIAAAARSKSVFAMEAMWTRFLPAAQALKALTVAGEIGDARLMTGGFGVSQHPDPSNGMFDPALGGGAVAHLGAYPLSLGQWLFGTPKLIDAVGAMGLTGVDEDAAFLLRYPQGVVGSFHVSLRAWARDEFAVLGSHGLVQTQGSIVRPSALMISRDQPRGPERTDFSWKGRLRQNGLVHHLAQRLGRSRRSAARRLDFPYKGNGYHYEADEVRALVGRGAVESTIMPLDDSVAVVQTMDAVRAAIKGRSGVAELRR